MENPEQKSISVFWGRCSTGHMMMRRSAIFDLDGTLTDSKPGILGCLTKALEAHGVAWTGSLDWFIGPPAEESWRRLMPDGDDARRAALRHDYRLCYDATGWAENSVYPGVHVVLQSLQASGWQLFVCTSKREDFALRILENSPSAAIFWPCTRTRLDRSITPRQPCSVVCSKSGRSIPPPRLWSVTATSISKPPARTA